MRCRTKLAKMSVVSTAVIAALSLLFIFSTRAGAQSAGNNAVCTSTTGCSSQSPSPAFIDASVFSSGHSGDVCYQIYLALQQLRSNGGVIDARGVQVGSGGAFTCTKTPWTAGSTAITTSSEILLPSGQINIDQTWVLPDKTRVFGDGMFGAGVSGGATGGTYLLATSNSVNPMIQFGGLIGGTNVCPLDGSGNYVCTGISAENLTLGPASGNQTVTGILNQYAQDDSYVDQVVLRRIALGLQIGPAGSNFSAANSGPYTNLFVNQASKCVEIEQSETRGLHGISCVGGDTHAIYLDASNTTIDDAHIENFSTSGVLIGGNGTAEGDVLANISAGGTNLPTTVEISSTVSDLTILGVSYAHLSTAPNGIQDDRTGATTGANVGLYADGDTLGGGYTLFSTSSGTGTSAVPSWAVGDTAPSGSSCPTGSIFSNTSTTIGAHALYVCSGGAWQPVV
jgi:hypothetical protein